MNTACVNPTIVEIEQCAYGNSVVDRFIRKAGFMESLDLWRPDRSGIFVYFPNKTKQSFLLFAELRRFDIVEDARNYFLAAQQFRRDRGVRLRSKRALIQMRRISGDQLAHPRR